LQPDKTKKRKDQLNNKIKALHRRAFFIFTHLPAFVLMQAPNHLLLMALAVIAGCTDVASGGHAPKNAKRKFSRILVVPLDEAEPLAIRHLALDLAGFFHTEAVTLPTMKMPANAWYAPRKRFWADSLLPWLLKLPHQPGEIIVGVTGKNISTTRRSHFNWGIMGLAYQPGQAAIVSDYRMGHAGLSDQKRFEKLARTARHELGHCLGLPHCNDKYCLMTDAEGKALPDAAKSFCTRCLETLGW
jgi:archaemetzincin